VLHAVTPLQCCVARLGADSAQELGEQRADIKVLAALDGVVLPLLELLQLLRLAAAAAASDGCS
jgi:hypothetical protein